MTYATSTAPPDESGVALGVRWSLVQIQSPRPLFRVMSTLLLTNDDGVHAAGLAALARAFADLGEVFVLAPEREQSACGHALTLHRPLRVHEVRDRWWGVNGTPS